MSEISHRTTLRMGQATGAEKEAIQQAALTARQTVGRLVSDLFTQAGIVKANPSDGQMDYAAFGEELKEVQNELFPNTRQIPYGDYVLESWASGALLPSRFAALALAEALKQRLSGADNQPQPSVEEKIETFLDAVTDTRAREEAMTHSNSKRPTELSIAYRTTKERTPELFSNAAKLGRVGIQQEAQQWNAQLLVNRAKVAERRKVIQRGKVSLTNRSNGAKRSNFFSGLETLKPLPDYIPTYAHYLNGTQYAPKTFTLLLSQLTQSANPPLNPPLPALHEQLLRERGDEIWLGERLKHKEKTRRANGTAGLDTQEKEKNAPLGQMIHAIRTRRGESLQEFSNSLAVVTGAKKPLSQMAIANWENGKSGMPVIPTGFIGNGATLCEEIILLAKTADRANYSLHRGKFTPWFDDNKEQAFRNAFARLINDVNNRDNNNYHHKLPSTRITGPLEAKEVQQPLRATAASVSYLIANGNRSPVRPKHGRE